MGYLYLSQYVAANTTDLSYSAYNVLLRMALVVKDEDTAEVPEGLYFQGWRVLAFVLGYGNEIYDDDTPLSPTAERAIGRAIRELRDKGYISVASDREQRRYPHRKVYRLSWRVVMDRIS